MNFLSIFWGGCQHERISWPITFKRPKRTTVSCLDCGRTFHYDWQAMRIAEEIRPKAERREFVPETYR